MKVILYMDKREGDMVEVPIAPGSDITRRISYLQAIEEGIIDGNKVADAAFIEGEDIPSEYKDNDKYLERVVEIDDAELATRYKYLVEKGYRGTPEKLAKLTAMHIEVKTKYTLATFAAMDIPSLLSVYDVLPTSNLKWDDIRDTLNAYGGVVNNNGITAFQSTNGVNKWSWRKPINHSIMFTLSDNDFIGANEDKLQGIFFGLKGAVNLKLSELHTANYEYVGIPKGGSGSPYRLGDFRGYARAAKPNLIGYLDTTTIDWSAPSSFRVRLDVDTNGVNTTGVDISKFLSTDGSLTFANAYPCVLVDGYARALKNESTGSFTTIKHNNTWYSRFIAPDFPSALQSDKERTVTVFLTRYINGENGSLNLANKWQDVSQLASTYAGVTVPECIGVKCIFKRNFPYKPFEADQFSNVTQIGFNVSFRFTDGLPDNNITYEIRVSSTDVNVPYITNWQYTKGGQTNPVLSFKWIQLGIVAMPSGSEEVKVEVWYEVSSVERYLVSSRVETLKIG